MFLTNAGNSNKCFQGGAVQPVYQTWDVEKESLFFTLLFGFHTCVGQFFWIHLQRRTRGYRILQQFLLRRLQVTHSREVHDNITSSKIRTDCVTRHLTIEIRLGVDEICPLLSDSAK